jgi:hypothetical protein
MTMLESSSRTFISRQSPLTIISSISCEKMVRLTKMKKNEKKVLLMICMQFLRHYCMDQVQRVSIQISG